MKKNDIKIGETYFNSGAGKTFRKVLDISKDLEITWWGEGDPPNEPVVEYCKNTGGIGRRYLTQFARWAGGIVPKEGSGEN